MKKVNFVSLILGTIGGILFGIGMCMCLHHGMDALVRAGHHHWRHRHCGVAVAYPLYVRVTKKQREKIAPQVLALSEELMGQ